MPRTAFAGTGFYVPDRVVKNDELTQYMDTSDEWIIERTGIQERRWVTDGMTSAEMACRASKMAISAAGIEPGEIDAIVLGTLSPDVFFPGTGVFLQRDLGLEGIPALDVRAQCSGFVYGLSVADAWIKSGQYRTILLVGVEIHSTGIDVSTRAATSRFCSATAPARRCSPPRTSRIAACSLRTSMPTGTTPRYFGPKPRVRRTTHASPLKTSPPDATTHAWRVGRSSNTP